MPYTLSIDHESADTELIAEGANVWRDIFYPILSHSNVGARLARGVGAGAAGFGIGFGIDKLVEHFTGIETKLGRTIGTGVGVSAGAFSPEIVNFFSASQVMDSNTRQVAAKYTVQHVIENPDIKRSLGFFGLGPECPPQLFAKVAQQRIERWDPTNFPANRQFEASVYQLMLQAAAQKLAILYGEGRLPV